LQETSVRMTQAGVALFRDYVQPDAMRAREAAGAKTLVALERNKIIGLLHVRQNHVSLFFVAARCRRRGIGRRLFEIVDELCPPRSVHSSVDAVGAYERLGFRGAGPEQMHDGLRFVPMERRADSATG
jgi:GNAT superfamily N-acetyltransferase